MKKSNAIFGKLLHHDMLMLLALLIMVGCQKDHQPLQSGLTPETSTLAKSSPVDSQSDFVPGELIVRFTTGLSDAQRETILRLVSGTVGEKIHTKAMQARGDTEGLTLVQTPLPIVEAINALRNITGLNFVEPNYYYQHDATSNDTYFTNGSLWGMYGDATSPANQYGSQAGEAWAAGNTGSSTVYVGVIDEGVMDTHQDLSGQVWTNPFDPVDGVDNDGNGYKDDFHGWDFAGNNNSTYDGTADDHGTHVAGTIGAKGGNGTGVVGVCWNVKIIAAKFLGSKGGTTANAIKAVDYMTDLKTRHGLNIVATNNSWGGGAFSQGLYDAIERANAAGILFVAAAGNGGSDNLGDNNDAAPYYPASYANSNIISVAAIMSDGSRSSFSNYGAASVDIGAPGSGIYSTIPGKNNASTYKSYNGTSMATPHVTGAAALYAASHAGATAAQIKSVILSSAVSTSALSGKCVTGGRLNVSGF